MGQILFELVNIFHGGISIPFALVQKNFSSSASSVSPLALLALEVVLGEVEIWGVGGKFSMTC